MLTSLKISNFVLVDQLEIHFDSGLTALTGETGAGKSLILDALQGVLGGRTSPELIRQGCAFAYLEASFMITPPVQAFLARQGFEELCEEPLLVVSKTIHQSGSKSRLNGQLIAQSVVRELGHLLIDSVGQHENQILFCEESHVEFLDALGDSEHQQTKADMRTAWQRLQALRQALSQKQAQARELQRQQDFLRFQCDEINQAALQVGEEENLERERERLRHCEKLQYTVQGLTYALRDQEHPPALLDTLQHLQRQLDQASRYDPHLATLSIQLEQISEQLDHLCQELEDYGEGLEHHPHRLEEVEERLSLIRRLKNKYGTDIPAILDYAQQAQLQLEELQQITSHMEQLKTEIAAMQAHCTALADKLSATRQALAAQLKPLLEQALRELGMEKTRFEAELCPASLGPQGQEQVRFLLSPNPGEPLRPLKRIASGGEMSRILLAFKLILKQQQSVSTLIFDEIDSGISGKTALAVADKLAQLAKNTQILCITHLPVIAAAAEHQFWIEKQSDRSSTRVSITALDTAARILRLAQMGNGKVTATTLENAREMMARARGYTQIMPEAC